MRPLLTSAETRALDVDASERLGIPSIVLMENAGAFATQALLARFAGRLASVVVVGGPGQNGGDAWVVARQLWLRGHRPRVVLVGDATRVSGDARVNLDALDRIGCEVTRIADVAEVAEAAQASRLAAALTGASLVVDGLFGTGLARPVEGLFAQAVDAINRCGAPVLALDLPSGVDADTGRVLGACVQATLTTTFAACKRGLYQHPARAAAGEITLVPIGVPGPGDVEGEQASVCHLLEDSDVATAVPARAADAHKGTAGHVLVVAGDEGKTGAALLAGSGALSAGAGLVTIATRAGARAAIDGRVPELMTTGMPDGLGPALAATHAAAGRCQAVVLGPGFGTDRLSSDILAELALTLPMPAVLDADALTALAGQVERLRAAAAPRILTPHPGEAARLLHSEPAAIQADRYGAARELAARCGQVVVLKGAGTVIAHGERLRVCDAGTPAMAAGGMGDVLAGMAGALLAGRDPLAAACAAVQLHARAGELSAASDRGLRASELAARVPVALAACRSLPQA